MSKLIPMQSAPQLFERPQRLISLGGGAAGSRVACALTVVFFAVSHAWAAEEMTEAHAITELERLGAYVTGIDSVAAGKREIARATSVNLGPQHAHEKMRLLKHLPRLEMVSAYEIDDTGLAEIQHLRRLRFLSIRNSNVTERGLAHLVALAALTQLDVEHTKISRAGIAELPKLSNLRHLSVSGSGADDAALADVSALTKLETLSLLNTRVTGAGLAAIRRLPLLTRLTVTSSEIRDGAIGELRGLRLKDLRIGDAITDAGLRDLRVIPELRSLILDGLPITDAGLAHLGALPNLESLSLNHTSITDAGMDKLAALTTLRRLGLNGTKITDRGLEKLRPPDAGSGAGNRAAEPRDAAGVGLSSVVELRLEDTAITDAGLKVLAKFDGLSILFLRGTNVTDEGMDDLQRTRRVSIRSWPRSGAGGGGSSGERPVPPDVVRDRDKRGGTNTPPARERARTPRTAGDDEFPSASDSAWKVLFDGSSFKGWKKMGSWTLQDSAAVTEGGSITREEPLPREFEMKFECWCDEGVQLTLLVELKNGILNPLVDVESAEKRGDEYMSPRAWHKVKLSWRPDSSNDRNVTRSIDGHDLPPVRGWTAHSMQFYAEGGDSKVAKLRNIRVRDLAKADGDRKDVEEMTEAEAIQEIERLGGEVREAAPPPDPTSATPRARFLIASLGEESLRDQLKLLKYIAALEIVRIRTVHIDDELADLKSCTRLRSLHIIAPADGAISDKALADIGNTRSLTDLDLGMAAVSEVGLAHIAKLENLEQLRASGCGITDAALGKLAMLTKLKRLTLSDTVVTNAGVAELRRLANLQQVAIHSKDIRDGAIGELKGLNLTELSIGDAITDAGLKDLANFKTLRVLDLAGLPITDDGLKFIPQMTTQSILTLDRTKISDAGLDELRRLAALALPGRRAAMSARARRYRVPGLIELHLEHTAITDAGLKTLQAFEHLPVLYLRGTNVTEGGLDELQRTKGARIRTWPGPMTAPGAGGPGGSVGRQLGPSK